MTIKPWTEADDATLRKMRALDISLATIGEQLGRSRNSVVGRWNRLKAAVAQSPMLAGRQAQRDAIAVGIDPRVAECMAEHGGTVDDAAALLGMTKAQVRTSWRRIKDRLGWQAC